MITIKMRTDNDAFVEDYEQEVSRILREIADKIEAGETPIFIRDINRNKVGTIDYEPDTKY